METFTLEPRPQRVVFGVGAVDGLPHEVDRLGAERVLLITGGAATAAGSGLAERLDGRVVATCAEVRQHVPRDLAQAARNTATANGADALLAVGGGSAIGLAKAVALTADLPIVAVPTTYAGSELTDIYGITSEHKQTGRDARVLPRVVLYDPTLTQGLSARATGATGFNAIAHGVEALYAPGSTPLARLHGEESIRVLAEVLPRCVRGPTDIDARAEALYGAYLAGTALAAAGTALHHKLCHVLGGSFGLVHGELNAVLLPYVVAYNAAAAAGAMARVARALGCADAAEGLRALARTLGLPTSLAEIGMPADGLDVAAERAAAEVGAANPRVTDAASIRLLLDDAYAGREPGTP